MNLCRTLHNSSGSQCNISCAGAFRPILNPTQLCGAAILHDDLGQLAPWPPYPLKFTPVYLGTILLGHQARGPCPHWWPQKDVEGSTSCLLVARCWVCWHCFVHMCMPICPTSVFSFCMGMIPYGLFLTDCCLWPVYYHPLHTHSVSSTTC